MKAGANSSNGNGKVSPDAIASTNWPSSRRSEGEAIVGSVFESSLCVFNLRFTRIALALYLTFYMTTASIGNDSGKRGQRRFLRINAGACCISTSCRIVCNCGSKRFFMYAPGLILLDMSCCWLRRHPFK
jgi:hypothetical protein